MISTSDLRQVQPKIGVQAEQDRKNYLWQLIAPTLYLGQQAGSWFVVDQGQMLNSPTIPPRAPGTRFTRNNIKLASDVFSGEQYGLETAVGQEENAKYASDGEAEAATFRVDLNALWLAADIRTQALATSNSVPSAAIATTWNDPASNPHSDVAAARLQVLLGGGHAANIMAVSFDVYEVLKQWAIRQGLVKFSDSDAEWTDLFARLFDVEEFAVGRAVANAANEGQALVVQPIWSNFVLVAYVDKTGDFMQPSFARTLCSDPPPADGATDVGATLFGYLQNEVKSGIVRVEHTVQIKITAPACGYRLIGALG